MDASVALASAYQALNGCFVLTELPVQVGEGHGHRTAVEIPRFATRRTGWRPPEMVDAHAATLSRTGVVDTRQGAREKELVDAP